MRIATHVLLGAAICVLGGSEAALAEGPSFNARGSELAALSREAGAFLHGALSAMHAALQYRELGQKDTATKSYNAALDRLASAGQMYVKVSDKAPAQPLVLDPRTEEDKRALDVLRQRLERRKVPFPKTERELAGLATRFVSDFKEVLASRSDFFEDTKETYAHFERLFREEAFLLDVGVVCSMVWDLVDSSRRQAATRGTAPIRK